MRETEPSRSQPAEPRLARLFFHNKVLSGVCSCLKYNHMKILDDGENDVQDDGRAVQGSKMPKLCGDT